jgi:hypothetical protein
MRFYRFESNGSSHLGVGSSDGKQVLDLTAVAPELPKNPLEFVAGFASTQSIVRQIIQSKQSSNWTYDLDSLQLLAPIPRPGKIAHWGEEPVYEECLHRSDREWCDGSRGRTCSQIIQI